MPKASIDVTQVVGIAVVVAIATLIFDAWIYWWHRINHLVPFFWRFHQIHHNDLEMDMSTALRVLPLINQTNPKVNVLDKS